MPIFKDKESQEMFELYFKENCFSKQTCRLVPEEMGYQVGEIVNDNEITIQNSGLFGLFSDEYKLRMSDPNYNEILS